jgi:hypothetical protein
VCTSLEDGRQHCNGLKQCLMIVDLDSTVATAEVVVAVVVG